MIFAARREATVRITTILRRKILENECFFDAINRKEELNSRQNILDFANKEKQNQIYISLPLAECRSLGKASFQLYIYIYSL